MQTTKSIIKHLLEIIVCPIKFFFGDDSRSKFIRELEEYRRIEHIKDEIDIQTMLNYYPKRKRK